MKNKTQIDSKVFFISFIQKENTRKIKQKQTHTQTHQKKNLSQKKHKTAVQQQKHIYPDLAKKSRVFSFQNSFSCSSVSTLPFANAFL